MFITGSVDPPARMFINVPAWPGYYDIEIDCVVVVKEEDG